MACMIKPDKYTNLDFSILSIGGMILKSLNSCPVQKYEDLENHLVSTLGCSSKVVFVNALTFLYAVGKINYQSTTDSINLVSE